MKIFAKRAWDFDPATWPVVSFSSKGDRDNLLRAAASGDQIILVGTQTKHTPRAKQGRLLGIAEIGEAVDTLSVVRVEESEENLFDGGQFRWPYAVLMAKPRRFEPQPLLRKELGDQLPIDPTVRAVQLSERDAAKVLSLPSVEILREKMLVGSSARRSPGQGDEAGGLRAKTGRIGSDSDRRACYGRRILQPVSPTRYAPASSSSSA